MRRDDQNTSSYLLSGRPEAVLRVSRSCHHSWPTPSLDCSLVVTKLLDQGWTMIDAGEGHCSCTAESTALLFAMRSSQCGLPWLVRLGRVYLHTRYGPVERHGVMARPQRHSPPPSLLQAAQTSRFSERSGSSHRRSGRVMFCLMSVRHGRCGLRSGVWSLRGGA